jgi:uncharacterized membrane-anchored protein
MGAGALSMSLPERVPANENIGAASMLNKVPQVTFMFWVIKIAATTLGETGGDAVSMSLNLGYEIASFIFLGYFLITLAAQVAARSYNPFLYWSVILSTTTVGTTISDYMDRTLGLGYPRASAMLFTLVLLSLATWKLTVGTVSVRNISTRKAEVFYWVTILISNTLGTALGDFLADSVEFGFAGGALVFGSIIALIALLYFYTNISRTFLFWAAFILTRPLGATLGDLLTKPHDHGGLDLSRFASSAVLLAFMVGAIWLTQRDSEVGPGAKA